MTAGLVSLLQFPMREAVLHLFNNEFFWLNVILAFIAGPLFLFSFYLIRKNL